MPQCGYEFLFQVDLDDSGTWINFPNQLGTTWSNANEQVDTTTKGSMTSKNKARQLKNCGVNSVSISCNGFKTNNVLHSALIMNSLMSVFFKGRIIDASSTVVWEGVLMVENYESDGDYNDAEKYSVSFVGDVIPSVSQAIPVLPAQLLVTDGFFHGWSVRRRLNSNYTGPIIQVQNQATYDNPTDIYPDENGLLDVPAIQAVAAGSSNGVVAVRRIYDQVDDAQSVWAHDFIATDDRRALPLYSANMVPPQFYGPTDRPAGEELNPLWACAVGGRGLYLQENDPNIATPIINFELIDFDGSRILASPGTPATMVAGSDPVVLSMGQPIWSVDSTPPSGPPNSLSTMYPICAKNLSELSETGFTRMEATLADIRPPYNNYTSRIERITDFTGIGDTFACPFWAEQCCVRGVTLGSPGNDVQKVINYDGSIIRPYVTATHNLTSRDLPEELGVGIGGLRSQGMSFTELMFVLDETGPLSAVNIASSEATADTALSLICRPAI